MSHGYEPPLLAEVLPELAADIAARLEHEPGAKDFAPQVPGLKLLSRCGCKEPGCASFTTGALPSGKRPAPIRTIALFGTIPGVSDIILDVSGGKIVYVEILDRPDIVEVLDKVFAGLRAGTA